MSGTAVSCKHKNAWLLEFKCLIYGFNLTVKFCVASWDLLDVCLLFLCIKHSYLELVYFFLKLSSMLAGSHQALFQFHAGSRECLPTHHDSSGCSGPFWLDTAIAGRFRSSYTDCKILGGYAEVKNVLLCCASLPTSYKHTPPCLPH